MSSLIYVKTCQILENLYRLNLPSFSGPTCQTAQSTHRKNNTPTSLRDPSLSSSLAHWKPHEAAGKTDPSKDIPCRNLTRIIKRRYGETHSFKLLYKLGKSPPFELGGRCRTRLVVVQIHGFLKNPTKRVGFYEFWPLQKA